MFLVTVLAKLVESCDTTAQLAEATAALAAAHGGLEARPASASVAVDSSLRETDEHSASEVSAATVVQGSGGHGHQGDYS